MIKIFFRVETNNGGEHSMTNLIHTTHTPNTIMDCVHVCYMFSLSLASSSKAKKNTSKRGVSSSMH